MSVCCCSLAGTVACDHCRNRSMTFEYSAGTTYSSEDFDFPKKKQTNADRIRNMTDEELAEWVAKQGVDCAYCRIESLCHEICKFGDCKKAWLEWLKQEVSDA